jgi:hypothetical protein
MKILTRSHLIVHLQFISARTGFRDCLLTGWVGDRGLTDLTFLPISRRRPQIKHRLEIELITLFLPPFPILAHCRPFKSSTDSSGSFLTEVKVRSISTRDMSRCQPMHMYTDIAHQERDKNVRNHLPRLP